MFACGSSRRKHDAPENLFVQREGQVVKRDLWTASLSQVTAPPWPCPACKGGILGLEDKSLRYEETAQSKADRGNADWEPDWTSYTFSAWLRCGASGCKLGVAVVGRGRYEADYDDEHGHVFVQAFHPLRAHPMPDVFELPASCPPEVSDPLRTAFALFWSDHAAAANSARVALERLLDAIGVKKKERTKKGRLVRLKTHGRIIHLMKRHPTIGGELMALKWLGNTGSHQSKVDREDILDGFEILEHALDELLNERSKTISKMVKKLTKKHGPKK